MGKGDNFCEYDIGKALSAGLTPRGSVQRFEVNRFLEPGHSTELHGEIIDLGDAELTVRDGDPALALRGLSELRNVRYQPSTEQYVVEFKDGTEVRVSLDPLAVAGDGVEGLSYLHGAMFAALGERARNLPTSESSREQLEAGDMFDAFMANRNHPGALRAAGEAIEAMMLNDGGELAVNDPALLAEIEEEKRQAAEDEVPVSPRAQARARTEAVSEQLRKVLQGPNPDEASYALVNHVDHNGSVIIDGVEEKKEAAKRLGGEHLIPESGIKFALKKIDETEDGEDIIIKESIGDYHVGPQEEAFFNLIKTRVTYGGQRFIVLRGDPGTGKDEALRQVAAQFRMPLVQLNLGPRYDLNDAVGGEGLGPQEYYEEVVDRDPVTGEPRLDKNGKPKMKRELKTAIAASKQVQGALARAVQEPCLISIAEPEGIEEDLVQLNSAFGNDLGDPRRRFLSINSISGAANVDIHPDCIIAITFNPGEEDIRLRTSSHDRALNFDFHYPDEDTEAKMMATKVKSILHNQPLAPGLAEREYTAEDVRPVVKFIRQLRQAHLSDPDTFRDFPGARQGARVFCDILMNSYAHDGVRNTKMDALALVRETLNYILPGDRQMSPDDRDKRLVTQMQDLGHELRDLVRLAEKIREEDAQKFIAEQKKSKKKTKAKKSKKKTKAKS